MSGKWDVAADDPLNVSQAYEDRYARTTDPRHRKIIGTFLEHIRTEMAGDLEAVVATMVREPIFRHYWGYGHESGQEGYDAVRTRYKAMLVDGPGIGNLRLENHRFIVDDDAICDEFTLTRIVPWHLAKQSGYEVDAEEGHYACRRRMVAIVPFDEEGLMVGELSYAGLPDPHDCERVPDDELSPGYRRWLERLERSQRTA